MYRFETENVKISDRKKCMKFIMIGLKIELMAYLIKFS